MKIGSSLLPCLLLGLAVAPSLSAQCADCTGDPGYSLTFPSQVSIGDPLEMVIDTPPQLITLFGISLGPGPLNTPAGCICLSWPLVYQTQFVTPIDGSPVVITELIPFEPGLCGITLYGQFVSVLCTSFGVSNLASVTIDGCQWGSACVDGRPALLTLRYLGEDCSASSYAQDPGGVTCTGDPLGLSPVHIIAADRTNLASNAVIWFDGTVDLYGTFDVDAAYASEVQLAGNTVVFVYDLGGTLLQMVKFHTSCSEPLFIGDQFGSVRIEGFVGVNAGG